MKSKLQYNCQLVSFKPYTNLERKCTYRDRADKHIWSDSKVLAANRRINLINNRSSEVISVYHRNTEN